MTNLMKFKKLVVMKIITFKVIAGFEYDLAKQK